MDEPTGPYHDDDDPTPIGDEGESVYFQREYSDLCDVLRAQDDASA